MFSICPQLPFDCIQPIFKQFTTSEQLHLRLVCRNWCNFIEDIFFCNKKVLQIFGSRDNESRYTLSVKRLNIFEGYETKAEEAVSLFVCRNDANGSFGSNEKRHFLADLFPNIKFLVIYCLHLESTDVTRLISSFSNLISLTFFGITKISPDQQTQIWFQISQLEKLDCLHLFDMKNCSLPVEILPKISQLKNFTLSDYYSEDQIIPILGSLQCKRLALEWIKCQMDDFERALTEMNVNLYKKLTNLTMGQFYATKFSPMDSVELLPFICKQFTELIYLDLGFVLEVSLT